MRRSLRALGKAATSRTRSRPSIRSTATVPTDRVRNGDDPPCLRAGKIRAATRRGGPEAGWKGHRDRQHKTHQPPDGLIRRARPPVTMRRNYHPTIRTRGGLGRGGITSPVSVSAARRNRPLVSPSKPWSMNVKDIALQYSRSSPFVRAPPNSVAYEGLGAISVRARQVLRFSLSTPISRIPTMKGLLSMPIYTLPNLTTLRRPGPVSARIMSSIMTSTTPRT